MTIDTLALDDQRIKEAVDAFRYMTQALRLSNDEAFSTFSIMLNDVTAVMIGTLSGRPDLIPEFNRIATSQYATAVIRANTEAMALVAMTPPTSGSVH